MKQKPIIKDGISYYFCSMVSPNQATQLPDNTVVRKIPAKMNEDGVEVSVTYHDSILDVDVEKYGGSWAIYSIPNRRMNYYPSKYDPMNGL